MYDTGVQTRVYTHLDSYKCVSNQSWVSQAWLATSWVQTPYRLSLRFKSSQLDKSSPFPAVIHREASTHKKANRLDGERIVYYSISCKQQQDQSFSIRSPWSPSGCIDSPWGSRYGICHAESGRFVSIVLYSSTSCIQSDCPHSLSITYLL